MGGWVCSEIYAYLDNAYLHDADLDDDLLCSAHSL